MFDSLAGFKRHTHHAVTTIVGDPSAEAIDRALRTSYDGEFDACRFAVGGAPGNRGFELHATSDNVNKEQLKEGLRRARALLEAGEIPTGARAL